MLDGFPMNLTQCSLCKIFYSLECLLFCLLSAVFYLQINLNLLSYFISLVFDKGEEQDSDAEDEKDEEEFDEDADLYSTVLKKILPG